MKVGLVDVDSHNFPNLVLMKLSAWHKNRGDQVELLKPADILKGQNLFGWHDKLYGACVFDWNRGIADQLEQFGVYMGGQSAYAIGNGQVHQLYLQNTCGALNCMVDPMKVIQKIATEQESSAACVPMTDEDSTDRMCRTES